MNFALFSVVVVAAVAAGVVLLLLLLLLLLLDVGISVLFYCFVWYERLHYYHRCYCCYCLDLH